MTFSMNNVERWWLLCKNIFKQCNLIQSTWRYPEYDTFLVMYDWYEVIITNISFMQSQSVTNTFIILLALTKFLSC